ncbi:MAG: M23 family metallopeptidase [Spirochaetia bacterium]|nr:M23 family metallopeptidase [Spirochaetia bacterium]
MLTSLLFAEPTFYYNSNFDRGDVVTVLVSDTNEYHTLELVNSFNEHIASNIFFPLNLNNFKGQAALIGLESTLKAGVYTLIIKKDGLVESKGEILIHENLFKKENISLNYDNTTLRTSTNPKITSEAVFIHEIYGTSRLFSVSGNKSLTIPIKQGIYTSWYGDRRNFIYTNGESSGSIHSGIDIAAPFGTKISAGYAGKVVFSGERIITGNSVVIEYMPGVYGIFFHLNEYLVTLGENVTEDTAIGTLGSSGLATGPHLHWEIRVAGVSVNPDSLLKSGLIDNSLIISIVDSYTAE